MVLMVAIPPNSRSHADPETQEAEHASAVGTFSSTFSRADKHPCASSPTARCRKTSNNLPVELRLIIFSLVYHDEYHEWVSKWLEHDVTPLTVFPYALTSVRSLAGYHVTRPQVLDTSRVPH